MAIAAWTSVRSKTPASAASWAWRTTCSSRSPSSPASSGVAPRLERVVDLVGLLEQVVAQRGVGLLAVPRAAVGLAQPVADPGHRPRSRRRPARARRGEVAGRRRGPPRRAPRRSSPRPSRTGRPDGPPGRAGGGRRAGRRRRGRAARAAAPAPVGVGGRAEHRERARSAPAATARWASPMSRSAATTWSPRAGSSPQRSRASATSASSIGRSLARAGPVIDGSRSIVDRGLLGRVPVRERVRLDGLELAALRRPALLGEDLEQVRPVVGDRDDAADVLPIAAAKIASVRRWIELALGDPAEVAALAGGLGPRSCRGRARRSPRRRRPRS